MQRSTEPELLDQPDIPAQDLHLNLHELHLINHWLGGYDITCWAIGQMLQRQPLPTDRPLHIVDIGSGGGDTLKAVARWGRTQGLRLRLTGVDLKPEAVDYARRNCRRYPEIDFVCADYRELPALGLQPDLIINALFCHHLSDRQLLALLRDVPHLARIGMVVNDLQRHAFAAWAIGLLTRLLSRSYLVRHDAPLSVRRSLTRGEWERLLQLAGVQHYRLHWRWAFRWALLVYNP